jgi:hypothetical protein
LYAKRDTKSSPTEAAKVMMEHHRSHGGKEWQNIDEDCETESVFIRCTRKSIIPQHQNPITRKGDLW